MVNIRFFNVWEAIIIMVKLELYRIFKAVCDEGNISEAAKSLFLTQSAVSQSIRQLEDTLQLQLFIRTPRGVTKTSAGELLYEYAASAVDLLLAAENKLSLMATLEYGELRIGASDTLSRYILLPKLDQFSKQFPKIKLQIINRTSSEAILLLKSGKIDLAFVNMPIEDENIDFSPYCEVSDIFVTAAGSKYCSSEFTLDHLRTLPLIFLEKKSNSRRYVEQFFLSQGVQIDPEIELGSHDLLLEFARIDLGISCVIEEFSAHYLESKELAVVKTTQKIPPRSIGIARLKGVSLSSAAKTFLEML